MCSLVVSYFRCCKSQLFRDFYNMNFVQVTNLVHDKQSSVLFQQQRGILHNPRMCNNFNVPMNLYLRDKGDRWRCNIRGCRSEVGLRKDTWLANSNLSYQKVVLFMYAWSKEMASIEYCKHEGYWSFVCR